MSVVIVIAVLRNICVIGFTWRGKLVKNRARNPRFVKRLEGLAAAEVAAQILIGSSLNEFLINSP